MRRYNIVSWILPILTVITFALAAPTLVRDKRQAYVDVVHVPKDVIAVLKKRMDWEPGMWPEYYDFLVGHAHQEVPAQPPMAPNEFYDFMVGHAHQEEPAPPPNVPPLNPVDSDREVMEVDGDAPAWSSESEDSHSEPPSPRPSTKSEDFHTAPSSPGPDSDSDPWSTVLNVPNTESLFENIKASDTEMGDKANVERRISGSVDSDAVKAAEMELRSTVDPGP